MKVAALVFSCLIGFVGCDNAAHTPADPNKPSTDRDNTGVNARDRDSAAKTPLDQKENQPDISVTANIRKRVVDTEMSTDAKNIKIITENGRVTLRGPVKSADEKNKINDIAVQVAGQGKVDNQLEIANSH